MTRLALAWIALSASVVSCGPDRPAATTAPTQWNVLLVSFDTTRADVLGCYGAKSGATPAIDALAREGVVFENAFSPVPLTLPSHATMLTGLDPSRHSARDNAIYDLPDDALTLAEVLKAQGRRTFAVVSSIVLLRRYRLDQGFDVYDDRGLVPRLGPNGEHQADTVERQADAVAAAARPLLEGSEPFFGFVHFYDAHQPYRAPPDLAASFPDPYLADLAFADRALQSLIDSLKRSGRLDRTVVIATSDHGEGRGEHGEATHGMLLHDATQHVPLVIRVPAAKPARCEALVRLCDLTPTVLDLVGAAALPGLDGRSLAPALRGEAHSLDDEDAYLEVLAPQLAFDFAPLYGIRTREWKLVIGARPHLWHLSEDRSESKDVAAAHPDIVAALTRKLVHLRDERGPALERVARAVTGEELKIFGGIGYVTSGTTDLTTDVAGLPDPHDHVAEADGFEEAATLAARGQLDEASSKYAKLVDLFPKSYAAQDGLGLVLGRKGEHAGALDHLLKAAAIHPEAPELHVSIALAAHFCQKPELAIRHLEIATTKPQCLPRAFFMLWDELAKGGDPAKARAVLERLLKRGDLAPADRAEAERILRSR